VLEEQLPHTTKPSHAHAAWSLHTTAGDFARFVSALLGPSSNGPLRAQAIETMLRPHIPLHDCLAWGLGWGLQEAPGGETLFWQWGDNPGYKAFGLAPGRAPPGSWF
jgi:hypothetical protein